MRRNRAEKSGENGAAATEECTSISQVYGKATYPLYSRLFVVCGRERNTEELQQLFQEFGAVASIHIALDRSQKSRVCICAIEYI